MTIAVIGAGASGMMAALQAAWNGGAVTLIERNAAVGGNYWLPAVAAVDVYFQIIPGSGGCLPPVLTQTG